MYKKMAGVCDGVNKNDDHQFSANNLPNWLAASHFIFLRGLTNIFKGVEKGWEWPWTNRSSLIKKIRD